MLTHSLADLNIDHRCVHEAVRVATRPVPGQIVREVYAFEVPSSTEYGLTPFRPNVFVDIDEYLHLKVQAMAIYDQEIRSFPHPRSREAIEALARLRGGHVGMRAAEAFEVIRCCV